MNQHALDLSNITDSSPTHMRILIDEVVVNPQFITVIHKHIKEKPYFFTHLSEKINEDEDLLINLLPHLIKFEFDRMWPQFYETYHTNREVVLHIVKHFGVALKKVSDDLKNDEEIVRIAVKNHAAAFEYASLQLRSNPQFFLSLMNTIDNKSLSIISCHLASSLKDDKVFMMQLIKKNGFCYIDVCSELMYDMELLSAAVVNASDASVLSAAPSSIKNNKDIMMQLIQINPNCYYFASAHLKDDYEIIYLTLQRDINLYSQVSKKIQEEIGTHDPVQYLSAIVLKNKLEKDLDKHDTVKTSRIKI